MTSRLFRLFDTAIPLYRILWLVYAQCRLYLSNRDQTTIVCNRLKVPITRFSLTIRCTCDITSFIVDGTGLYQRITETQFYLFLCAQLSYCASSDIAILILYQLIKPHQFHFIDEFEIIVLPNYYIYTNSVEPKLLKYIK